MPIVCRYQRPNPQKRIFKPPAIKRISGEVRLHGFPEEEVWRAVRTANGMEQDSVARIYVAVIAGLARVAAGVLDTIGDLISLWRSFSTARAIIRLLSGVTPITLSILLAIRVLFTVAKYAERLVELVVDLPDVLAPIIGEPTEDELAEAARRVDDIIGQITVFFDFNVPQ